MVERGSLVLCELAGGRVFKRGGDHRQRIAEPLGVALQVADGWASGCIVSLFVWARGGLVDAHAGRAGDGLGVDVFHFCFTYLPCFGLPTYLPCALNAPYPEKKRGGGVGRQVGFGVQDRAGSLIESAKVIIFWMRGM